MSLVRVPLKNSQKNPVTPAEASGDAQAWRELALDSLMAGEPAAGLWFLRNAIEAASDDPETWQLMGRCFEEMGEESRARKCFLLALRQHARSGANTQLPPPAPLSLYWRRRQSRDI